MKKNLILALDKEKDLTKVIIKTYKNIKENEIENLIKSEGIFYFNDDFFYDYYYDGKNKVLFLALVKSNDLSIENKKELLLNLKEGNYIFKLEELLYIYVEIKKDDIILKTGDIELSSYKKWKEEDIIERSCGYKLFSVKQFEKKEKILEKIILLVISIAFLINAVLLNKVVGIKTKIIKKIEQVRQEKKEGRNKLKDLINFLKENPDITIISIKLEDKKIKIIYKKDGYVYTKIL